MKKSPRERPTSAQGRASIMYLAHYCICKNHFDSIYIYTLSNMITYGYVVIVAPASQLAM